MKHSCGMASLVVVFLLLSSCAKVCDGLSGGSGPRWVAFEGWSSGGGEILGDANNPWFLENTHRVSYCIVKDDEHFAGLRKPVGALVASALADWKKTFRLDEDTAPIDFAIGRIKIATQDFVEAPCSDETDIRFQFGVLSGEQFRFLGNPRKFIGAAVRTHYDEVNLRAKGFIYVSADGGSLGYEGKNLVEGAWHLDPEILRRVLLHELGHVFGVRHGVYRGIMAAEYPERILQKRDTPPDFIFASDIAYPFRLKFRAENEHDFLLGEATRLHTYLGVSTSYPQLGFKIDLATNQMTVRAFATTTSTSEGKIVGTAKFNPRDPASSFSGGEPAVTVDLGEKQKVFPWEKLSYPEYPSFHAKSLVGPRYYTYVLSGTFRNLETGLEKPIYLRLSYSQAAGQSGLTIGGILDGKLILDLLAKPLEAP